jgi:hypothetical protein
MHRHHSLVSVALLLACAAAPAAADPLRPVAGDRVVENATSVSAELQAAIATGSSVAAENLRRFVDTDDAFRIYHRDHQLLIAMTARRNIFLSDRIAGERQAAALARTVLQERFPQLFASAAGFRGLDADTVRVVFIEPDAFDSCPGRRGPNVVRGTGWQQPVPFGSMGLWSNGWATPQPCTGCR